MLRRSYNTTPIPVEFDVTPPKRNNMPDLTGYIFHFEDSWVENPSQYWKITGPKSCFGTYPVINCSKYGKEYTRTTSFDGVFVERLYEDGLLDMCTLPPDQIKARKPSATEPGKRQMIERKIKKIEAEIADANARLIKAKNQLALLTLNQLT